jgi:hypothetical protein
MEVTYFRPQRPGPESIIENAVARCVPDIFPSDSKHRWAAGSLPIGAGVPDLVIVVCEPQLFALAQTEIATSEILAYLRAVGRARIDTITSRLRQPREVIIRRLNGLVEAEAVSNNSDTFSLLPRWRHILPEIVTVEAKVSNWRKAVDQASRNRIFAHKSFVALPDRVAQRVQSEEIFGTLGLGLLSVDENLVVKVLKESRRGQPRVWTYYYDLAFLIASHKIGLTNDFHSADGGCPSRSS